MGLLDGALSALGGNHSPQQGAEIRLVQAVLELLTNNQEIGGLNGLLDRFRGIGMGNAASSWVGDETNVPLTAEHVRLALGDGPLQQVADQAGVDPDQAADALSTLLPTVVDKLTPAGHVPQGGLQNLGSLLEHFIKF